MSQDKVRHEFDATGRHRIVVNERNGEWAQYAQPAFSRDPESSGTKPIYIALTAYWGTKEHYFRCEPVTAELKEI